MGDNLASDLAHQFVENNPLCTQALRKLRAGTEIKILLEDSHEYALFFDGSKAQLKKRSANHADIEFWLYPEALRRLETFSKDNMGLLGIQILKEIVDGTMDLRMGGSMVRLLRGGYLNVIAESGPEFAKYLASYGIKNLTKLVSRFRNLTV